MNNVVGLMKSLSIQAKVVAVLILAYFVVFCDLGWREYMGLKMQMNDMGNVVQAIYNTTAGRGMEFSNGIMYENPVTNRLGGHANVILFFIVPVFAVIPDPRVLIVVQVAMVASGVIPIYLLSKKYLGLSWWSVLMPFLYVINPVIADASLFDFHALTVALPLVVWAMYLMLSRKWREFGVAAVLASLCKEDVPLMVAMMGVYMWWRMGERKKGWLVIVGAMAYFGVMVGVVMPILRDGQVSLVEVRYGRFGGGLGEILVGMLTRPVEVVQLMMGEGKGWYVPGLLAGVGFVGGLVPFVLAVALPAVVINLLSGNLIMSKVLGFYYPATIMAVVMVAGVVGFGGLAKRKCKYWWWVGGWMLVVGVVIAWMYSPVPGSRVSRWSEFEVGEHAKKFEEVRGKIPGGASVSVQNNLGSGLAMRERIITFPYGVGEAEFVVLDVTDPYQVVRVAPRQRNFVYIVGMSVGDYREQVEAVFERGDYGVVLADDGYLVFEKGRKSGGEEAREMFEERMKELEERYQVFTTSFASGG